MKAPRDLRQGTELLKTRLELQEYLQESELGQTIRPWRVPSSHVLGQYARGGLKHGVVLLHAAVDGHCSLVLYNAKLTF